MNTKVTEFSRDYGGNIYQWLKLYEDNTFRYKSGDVCDDSIYQGEWERINDTLVLSVIEPNIYNNKLEYELKVINNEDNQFIKLKEGNTSMHPFSLFITSLTINNSKSTESMNLNQEGEVILNERKTIKCLNINFPPPYSNQNIILDKPTDNSIEIIFYSIPETYCKLPEKTYWLMKKEKIYRIENDSIQIEHFLKLNDSTEK
ncbi:MAG: hypothetical protein R2785_09475 [Flavobacteriaceae bacterium]